MKKQDLKNIEDYSLEDLIFVASPHIRQIVFHSDGRIVARTGGRARYPKKLYGGSGIKNYEKLRSAVMKLIKENV